MADPYDIIAAIAKAGGKTYSRPQANIGQIGQILANAGAGKSSGYTKAPIQAANTGGLAQPQGFTSGGGGGSPAVSVLDALPKTPEIQALIAKGIINANMTPEQIQAIISIAGVQSQVPLDIAALKAQITGDYTNAMQPIQAQGADWMQQIMGANYDPNNPNAALYMQDPMFADYAGGLAQQSETADTNMATDLAWMDKQQQLMNDYYSGLIAAGGAGTLTGGGGGSGGGGGGGGHYGGGGGGGSSSGGPNPFEFTDPKTTITQNEAVKTAATSNLSSNFPGFYNTMIGLQGDNPEFQQWARDFFDINNDPMQAASELSKLQQANQATLDAQEAIGASNAAWLDKAPADFETQMRQYMNAAGVTRGDDPSTEDTYEWFYPTDPNAAPNLINIDPAQQDLFYRAFDPESMPGGSQGMANAATMLNHLRQIALNRVKQQQDQAAAAEDAANQAAEAAATTTAEATPAIINPSALPPGQIFTGTQPMNEFGVSLPQWGTDPAQVIELMNAQANAINGPYKGRTNFNPLATTTFPHLPTTTAAPTPMTGFGTNQPTWATDPMGMIAALNERNYKANPPPPIGPVVPTGQRPDQLYPGGPSTAVTNPSTDFGSDFFGFKNPAEDQPSPEQQLIDSLNAQMGINPLGGGNLSSALSNVLNALQTATQGAAAPQDTRSQILAGSSTRPTDAEMAALTTDWNATKPDDVEQYLTPSTFYDWQAATVVDPQTGEIRPDVLEMMQQQSTAKYRQQAALSNPQNPEQYVAGMGEFYDPGMTPEQISDLQRIQSYMDPVRQAVASMNPYVTLAPFRDTLVDTSSQGVTSSQSQHTYSPDLANLISQLGNLQDVTDAGVLDIVPEQGDVQPMGWRAPTGGGSKLGFSGGARVVTTPQSTYTKQYKPSPTRTMPTGSRREILKRAASKGLGRRFKGGKNF